jgi:primosomal protein N'
LEESKSPGAEDLPATRSGLATHGAPSGFEERPADRLVSVLVPVAVAGTYSYRVPGDLAVAPGDIVAVPLGTREVVGVVWDDPPDAEIGHNRLRSILGRLDAAPSLAREIRAFVDWVANYTLATRGMVLRWFSAPPAPSCQSARRPACAALGLSRSA